MTPGAGACVTISPTGTTGSNASVFVPGARPAVNRSWSASGSVLFRRSGTATVATPTATVSLTGTSGSICTPATGSWVRTLPTWVLSWTTWTPFSSASAWASVNDSPTKFGTATGPVGAGSLPESSRNTRKPARARMTIAMIPAIQTIGLVPDGSSSSATGGGGGGGLVAA